METIKIFSKGWNFSQDGPGNRLLYHFQGCNFVCPWCSNPEGISLSGSLLVKAEKLIDSVCPHGAIRELRLDRTKCEVCTGMECIRMNRNEGIRLSAQEYTIDDLLCEIEGAKNLFHSGGGVTFTGGEPTLQFRPLKHLLKELRKRVHIVMETNGTHLRLPELFEWIDLLIIDLKQADTAIHKQVLGLGNEQVIRNLEQASATGVKLWIRIPLIPGFNNDRSAIEGLLRIIKRVNRNGISVELLRYHEYGKIKWEQIGKVYTMPEKKIPAEQLRQYRQLFSDNNIQMINT
ncbi:MAG: glycyl-radical enzyme activating protein [Tannerellaceae bacterium]|jgi:pyruvate formate lyase activating enzyme|nr:glycyl-radical enzyme activating protein [Tannerellaceae bacterium]